MISFIHIAKNANTSDLGGYGDVILDACCHNIVSSDEIWNHAVEMSVLFVTSLQRNNPRSKWYTILSLQLLSFVLFCFFFGAKNIVISLPKLIDDTTLRKILTPTKREHQFLES